MKSQTRRHAKWCSPNFMQHFSLWTFYRGVMSVLNMRAMHCFESHPIILLTILPSLSLPQFISTIHSPIPTHPTTAFSLSFAFMAPLCSSILLLVPLLRMVHRVIPPGPPTCCRVSQSSCVVREQQFSLSHWRYLRLLCLGHGSSTLPKAH